MRVYPLRPGQLARLNTTLTGVIVWTTMRGGHKYIIHTYLMGHILWQDTLPPPHSFIQMRPLYHISGRAEKSNIPVDVLLFSCTVIRFLPLPRVKRPHSYSWGGRSSVNRPSSVCACTTGPKAAQSKHTKVNHSRHV